MGLEALIFDVDGTLADTERDGHRVAFNRAFEEFRLGWTWDVDLYGKLLAVTGGKERIRFFVERFLPPEACPADLETLVVELHRCKTRHFTEMLGAGGIPLRPGVRRLLVEARESGLRLAIATTTTPENVAALLRHSLAEDAETWFDAIAAGDVVPAKKPAPDIYFKALTMLGLGAESCIAFEDSDNGLKASMGAGLKTLVTVNAYTAEQAFPGALAVLEDLGEPSRASRVLQGDLRGHPYVDVALLRVWCREGG